ncbi:hybrid sensor histidine kinase/response regulator [Paraliomyxa miuraensis]|uniref:hybrid sensor histidine kinase/response regulator n=1 Tax=Paraliomyxa miuraensis TaxID=376150 RepID=UPI0022556575|nr:ATP-binding protein [Paraliomyxa miuraensis]MCX4241367.1 ATP-binding protein [Paraliomyxa miuraensis]
MAIGLIVLVGWVSGWSWLTSFIGHGVPTRPNTAVGLVLAGIGLWTMARDPTGLSSFPATLGGLVAGLGLVTVAGHLVGRGLVLDQLLSASKTADPGPMALGTALGLVLAGVSMLLRRFHAGAASVTGLGVLLVGTLMTIEYLLGIEVVYGVEEWRSAAMALPTALGLLVLGGGLLLTRPRRGFTAMLTGHGPGATLARRMTPVAVLVPVGVAWLSTMGAHPSTRGHEGLSFGVVTGMAMLLAATHWTSVWLQRTELSRQRARDRLARREHQLEKALLGEREARRRADFEAATHRTLRRLATSFSQHREQEALVQHIIDEATALVDATVGTLCADSTGEAGVVVRLHASSGRQAAATPIEPNAEPGPPLAPEPGDVAEAPAPPATPSMPRFEADVVIVIGDTNNNPEAANWLPRPLDHPPVRSVLGAPVVTSSGQVLGGLLVGHPEPKHFDDEDVNLLRKIAEIAATALETAQLMAALRRSEAQAHEADRRKDQFLAMVGHELRNPLAPIAAALEMLHAQGRPGQDTMWSVVNRQMRHLRRLVDDLLDVARIGRGMFEVTPHATAMTDVVTLGVEMVRDLVHKRRHTLTVDVPEQGLAIVVDEHRMAQVVANLLSNAAKYTEPGGHLEVAARRNDDSLTVTVRDDGPGIDDHSLASLFGPFVQGPRTLDRADGGLGLGLTLARAIVERHGGTITGRRLRPRGTEFTVVLPQAELPAAPIPIKARRHHHDRALQVLVVDDNEDAAQMLSILMGSWGYQCSTAIHPNEALALVEREPPDVAIVDIGLPDMSGYELVGHLRKILHHDALIVALTGYGQSRDREQALEAGFDAHFTKPVSSKDLRTMLEDFGRQRAHG